MFSDISDGYYSIKTWISTLLLIYRIVQEKKKKLKKNDQKIVGEKLIKVFEGHQICNESYIIYY